MVQTTGPNGVQMVLMNPSTRTYAPDSVQVGADGAAPSGYIWVPVYSGNLPVPQPVAAWVGGLPSGGGFPSMPGSSPYFTQQQPTYGGEQNPTNLRPDWLQPVTQGPQDPYANQPPGVTGGTMTPEQITQYQQQNTKPSSTSWLKDYLGTIIGAGTALGGALIQKSSSDKATDAQTDAANKAVALTEKMYEQDRADYAPYRNIGAFSLGQLGHLTGMPPDFGTKAVSEATAPRTAVQRAPTTSNAQPTPSVWGRITSMENPAVSLPEFQSLRDLGAQQQSASSFVRMRAPDGEEADIPPHEVALFESHGATRI